MNPTQQEDEVLRWDQCQLALRTILDALPEHGRMNARDVSWLRSVARAGLGEDPFGAQLETAETVWLRIRLADAEAEQDAPMQQSLLTDAEIDALARNIEPRQVPRYNDAGTIERYQTVHRLLPPEDANRLIVSLRAARTDLATLTDAARGVLAVEWDMVDPQHRTFAHQFPEMLDAIRRLRDVVEGLENDNLLQGARREPHARLRRQWSMAGARGVVGSQG